MQLGAGVQALHFVDEAVVQHLRKALGDAGVQLASIARFQADDADVGMGLGLLAGGVQGGQGLTGDLDDFQRALDALGVGGVQALGGDRIQRGQTLVQVRPAVFGGFGIQPGADVGTGTGQVVHGMQQRARIQHRATHQQRQAAACLDLVDQPPGIGGKFCSAVALNRVADIDKVVRRRISFFGRGLGGADVHVAVHQRRVHADDLHRQVSCQFQR